MDVFPDPLPSTRSTAVTTIDGLKAWAIEVYKIPLDMYEITGIAIKDAVNDDDDEEITTEEAWAEIIHTPHDGLLTVIISHDLLDDTAENCGGGVLDTQPWTAQSESQLDRYFQRPQNETDELVEHIRSKLPATNSVERDVAVGYDLLSEILDAVDSTSIGSQQTATAKETSEFLESTSKDWMGLAEARQYLAEHLGNHRICTGLPSLRHRDPDNPAQYAQELDRKPHQTIALAWMLSREFEIDRGILADTMGMGKTFEYLSNMIASNFYWADRQPVKLPTCLLTTRQTFNKLALTCHHMLGTEWNVFQFGEHEQLGAGNSKRVIRLDRLNPVWNCDRPEQNLVIMTYDNLQTLRGDLGGFFDRVIADEGHFLRNGVQTRRGQTCRSFAPRFFWIVTGTPFVDNIQDIYGYLSVIEKPSWSDPSDRNTESIDPDRRLHPDLKQKVDQEGTIYRAEIPFASCPYDEYHPLNENNRRCLTTAAMAYWIIHLLRKKSSPQIVKQRLHCIIEMLMLGRTHLSVYIDADGEEHPCGEALPDIKIERVRIADHIKAAHTDMNKVLVRMMYHRTADPLFKLLNYIGIRTEIIHRKMSGKARDKVVDDFCTQGGLLVLITTFSLRFEGVDNLQHRCNFALAGERAYNYPTESQFMGRIYNTGQTQESVFRRYYQEDSYQKYQDYCIRSQRRR